MSRYQRMAFLFCGCGLFLLACAGRQHAHHDPTEDPQRTTVTTKADGGQVAHAVGVGLGQAAGQALAAGCALVK